MRQPYTGPSMNRPVPVVLSTILLGILAFFALILAVVMLFTGVAMVHHSLPQMAATPTPFPPGFMSAMMIGFSVFYVAVAVWFILTLIGLIRLRSWARYSVLVIAGLVAVFGMGCTIVSFAIHPILRSSANTAPGADPQMMGAISFFIGGFYLIITAVAAAHLIYFNRARTRAVFQQADPVPLGSPNTSTGRYRPASITIMSWLFMVYRPFLSFMPSFRYRRFSSALPSTERPPALSTWDTLLSALESDTDCTVCAAPRPLLWSYGLSSAS